MKNKFIPLLAIWAQMPFVAICVPLMPTLIYWDTPPPEILKIVVFVVLFLLVFAAATATGAILHDDDVQELQNLGGIISPFITTRPLGGPASDYVYETGKGWVLKTGMPPSEVQGLMVPENIYETPGHTKSDNSTDDHAAVDDVTVALTSKTYLPNRVIDGHTHHLIVEVYEKSIAFCEEEILRAKQGNRKVRHHRVRLDKLTAIRDTLIKAKAITVKG